MNRFYVYRLPDEYWILFFKTGIPIEGRINLNPVFFGNNGLYLEKIPEEIGLLCIKALKKLFFEEDGDNRGGAFLALIVYERLTLRRLLEIPFTLIKLARLAREIHMP